MAEDPHHDELARALAPPDEQRRARTERERERDSARSRLPGQQISGVTVLWRGLRRRCPRCGGRGLFASRFRIRDFCPTCGLALEREEGGFLGAMTLNYVVAALAFLAVMVAWLLVDLPDVHVAALTVTCGALVIVVPLAFFRSAKTLWAAVDFLVYRSGPDYVESPEG
jgi:uncharacterized protein (DUF983 family)